MPLLNSLITNAVLHSPSWKSDTKQNMFYILIMHIPQYLLPVLRLPLCFLSRWYCMRTPWWLPFKIVALYIHNIYFALEMVSLSRMNSRKNYFQFTAAVWFPVLVDIYWCWSKLLQLVSQAFGVIFKRMYMDWWSSIVHCLWCFRTGLSPAFYTKIEWITGQCSSCAHYYKGILFTPHYLQKCV